MKKQSTFLHCIAMLFLSSLFHATQAQVTIDMDDGKVFVRTDMEGYQGYQGCDLDHLNLVNAYVYTLYRKESKMTKTQTCNTGAVWVKVAEKKSNLDEEVFPNMPIGEYKATVYSGQAIGCNIDGETQSFPSKSIIYQQEKSKIFDFNPANTESVVSSNQHIITSDALSVFPNPTSGALQIQLKDHSLKRDVQIVFYDLLGQEIKQFKQVAEDQKFQEWQVDVSGFSEGAYILRVFDGEGNSYEKKVIVTDNK